MSSFSVSSAVSIVQSRKYSEGDEQFFRVMIFPEEERSHFTTAEWNGSFRWFRAPNVVCFEKYQRPQPRAVPPNEPGMVVRL